MKKASIKIYQQGKSNLKNVAIWRDYISPSAVKAAQQKPNWGERLTPPGPTVP